MPPKSTRAEIYEDRIARLEEGVSDCRVDIGVLKTQVADGFTMLSKKLDQLATLSDRVAAMETRELVREEVEENEEKIHTKRHDRRGRMFKIGAAVGSAIVAVVGIILKIWFGG